MDGTVLGLDGRENLIMAANIVEAIVETQQQFIHAAGWKPSTVYLGAREYGQLMVWVERLKLANYVISVNQSGSEIEEKISDMVIVHVSRWSYLKVGV
jgi:hypothetical protein